MNDTKNVKFNVITYPIAGGPGPNFDLNRLYLKNKILKARNQFHNNFCLFNKVIKNAPACSVNY